MKRLPYIDEYAIGVPAERAATWTALLQAMCRDPEDPSTVPFGFVLDEAVAPERFALKGRHWFAVYQLIFVLSDLPDGSTRLAAQTWAAFPGVKGRIYRGLVIGSGGHRVVVARMLRRIEALADKSGLLTTP
jgi:hypothetical protein